MDKFNLVLPNRLSNLILVIVTVDPAAVKAASLRGAAKQIAGTSAGTK
jgi:hypothetical protein